MMKSLLLFTASFIGISSFCQTTFMVSAGTSGNEYFYNIVQSPDGNYIATGSTDVSDGNGDTYVAKFNTSGQQIWSKVIATSNYDEGFGIINTSDGGFAVSGSVNEKMGISKFDASGNLSWSKQYNELVSSDASRLLQTTDGGYLLPGGISSDDFTTSQSYLIKTDASGVVQWSKKYFNTPHSIIYDVKKTNDNNYIFLALNYDNTGDGSDSAYIVKVNTTGNVIWTKYFSADDEYVDGYALTVTSDGGYLVTGESYNVSENGFILKVDGNGNYKWSKSTNVGTDLQGVIFYDAVETDDGGYVAAGESYTQDSIFFYLVKVNKAGGLVWTKAIRYLNNYNELYKIIKTNDKGYLAIGEASENTQTTDGFLIKFDANFNTCTPGKSLGNLINFGNLAGGTTPAYTGNTTVSAITPGSSAKGKASNVCSALPLTLINFSAALQNKSVNLQWKTAQESNTSHFDVEKSNDGKAFNFITKVDAAGNSNVVNNYAAADNNPLEGYNWYRLKMVDKDGQYSYSSVVKIAFSGGSSAVVFPNPAVTNAVVSFKAAQTSSYTAQVTDVSGKVLQTIKGFTIAGENKIKLDVSKYAEGVYIINLVTGESGKITLKLNKQ